MAIVMAMAMKLQLSLLACSESYPVLNIYTLPMFGDSSVNFKPHLVQSTDGNSLLAFTLLAFALLGMAWLM